MGNVPTKIEEGDTDGATNGSGTVSTRNKSSSITQSISSRSAMGNRAASNSVSSRSRPSGNSTSLRKIQSSKRKSSKDREQLKELHAQELVVSFEETVDGGYLAPFGCYSFEKLDYDAKTVKQLIINRQLAPFYTPLQDFNESWSRNEVTKIVDGLPLHAAFNDNPEEFDGVPTGNLNDPNFDVLIDTRLSKREQRKMHSKIFKARMYKKRIIWQEKENERFLELKLEYKAAQKNPELLLKNSDKYTCLASDDLNYSMYKNGAECPICFLYFPGPLNYSRCCLQPICTECFVQIKRGNPHFPHDEIDPTQPAQEDDDKDPNLLISEPANCPYCATTSFGITYSPPTDRKTGINGKAPNKYVSPDTDVTDRDAVLRVRSQDDPEVVFSDTIRPTWKEKLDKERNRLARRAANATAIHVSHRLINLDHSSNNSNSETSGTTPVNPSTNTVTTDRNNAKAGRSNRTTLEELENQMIQEAIKLSLEEHNSK